MKLLSSYDKDHPIRNIPLINIKAHYKSTKATIWREVFPNFGIASKSYNDLTEVWTKDQEWIATVDPFEWGEDRIDSIGQNGNEGLHYEQTDTSNTRQSDKT